MNQSKAMKIDVDKLLKERLPRHYRFIPRFIIRWVENIICQERMNELLEQNHGKTGASFCDGLLNLLNIKVNTRGEENIADKRNRRVILISNHPLGGLDGVALINHVTNLYGGKVHFIVNDLLMVLKPLHDVFLPINKHGKQSRASIKAIDDAFAGDDPILIFPAGMVSRKGKNGEIADLKWQKMFLTKSVEYQRDIIPMHFDGKNSPFFYNFAKFRTRIGLKFNIEMVLLPREMVKSENSTFTVSIGNTIPWQSLKNVNVKEKIDEIKRIVYNLKP